jgi:CHAD domain-containing protein
MVARSQQHHREVARNLLCLYQANRMRRLHSESMQQVPIMDQKNLYRRWKKRYVRGLENVAAHLKSCRKTGDAKAVHGLRVAIRRTRLLALMGRAVIGRKRVTGYRQWAQGLADALSPVRDYDVMIEWASQVCRDPEFARELAKDRALAWRDARKALQARPPIELRELRCLKPGGKRHRKVAAHYEKIATATREIIDIDAAGFEELDPSARHDFRRAVRRLKYLQELEKKPEQAERLKGLQMVLGELQNAQAIQELISNAGKRSSHARRLLRHAKRQECDWLTRCRRSVGQVVRWRSANGAHRSEKKGSAH